MPMGVNIAIFPPAMNHVTASWHYEWRRCLEGWSWLLYTVVGAFWKDLIPLKRCSGASEDT